MKMTVQPEKLLDEGKFSDFVKATALGAGIALSPIAHAHEINVDEVPTEFVDAYNVLDKTDMIGVVQAQHMAEEAIEQVGEQAVDGAPEQTKAWKTAKDAYVYLVSKDYKIATAFLGKFNVNAKKLFGSQIRPIPKPVAESVDLPVRNVYLNEFVEDDEFEDWKQKVVDDLSDGLLDLAVMSDRDIEECNKLLKSYYSKNQLNPSEAARWIAVDLKKYMRNGKSQFLTKDEIDDVKDSLEMDLPVNPHWKVV